MSEQKTSETQNIERFLATLPRGIKQQAKLMQSLDDGLLYPSTAIRYWQEVASRTDDGRPISSSGSQWGVVAWVSGRGWVADVLARETKQHYEIWSLRGPKPHIIDYTPRLEENLHGKAGRYTEIEEQDVRDFVLLYVIDYYGLHPSNHRFIEILSCGHHADHHANWECKVNFSGHGDRVTLLIQPTSHGLEVFAHEYEE